MHDGIIFFFIFQFVLKRWIIIYNPPLICKLSPLINIILTLSIVSTVTRSQGHGCGQGMREWGGWNILFPDVGGGLMGVLAL